MMVTMTTTTHKALGPDTTPTVENILRVYRQATEAQIAEGIAWYADAHTFAVALDRDDVARAAGILAALSPRLDWGKNMQLAARVYAENGVASGCLRSNARKAERIFAGEAPLDVLGGDKVRNFYGTILDPTDETSVVIDRHAFDVAIGRGTDDATRAVLSRKGVYEVFAECYREAARIAGVSPAQMQSITWVVWRETSVKFAAANVRKAGRDA